MRLNTSQSTRLRVGISYGNVCDLPPFSVGPHGSATDLHRAVADAGYEGLQGGDAELCARFDLKLLGSGLLERPDDADRLAKFWKARGAGLVTCIAGFGFESDEEIDAYAAAMIEAAASHKIAVLLETHRASITQDAWRTVQLARRFPELRFNLDLSHWFTGQEMPYGDLDTRLSFLAPVFARTSFLHGRIGDRCCMQVPIAEAGPESLLAFRQTWTQVMRSFLSSDHDEDAAKAELWFCPELLGTTYYYARQFRNAAGDLCEETDRWREAQALVEIAKDCFSRAGL